MISIWKVTLSFTEQQTIMLPEGAQILCAREQNGLACIWHKCDPMLPLISVPIAIVPTGGFPPADWTYVDTIFFYNASFVFHIFEGPRS